MKSRLPVLTTVVLLAVGAYVGHRGYRVRQHAIEKSPVAPAVTTTAGSSVAGSTDRRDSATRSLRGLANVTAGDQLLLQVITQLERRASVTARLRHQVLLSGRQLKKGVGSYWQQASGDELRVRLELQFFSDETRLLQVSNGRFLWTDCRLPTGRSIARLDLRKLRNEATREAAELDDIEPGRASWFPMQPELSIRYGGLPTLLAALADQFTFLPPQAMRWTPEESLAGVPEKFPVYAIVGHWKVESLRAILPEANGFDAADLPRRLDSLPERFPQEVLLLVGQTDLFPYRIEFRKLLDPPSGAAAGRTVPFQLSESPLVLLELEAVSIDAPIAAGQFDFSPGDAEWDDLTAEHLEKMRLDRQEKMAARHRAGQR